MEIEEVIEKLRAHHLSDGLPRGTRTETPQATPEQVDEIERKLSAKLLPDYRRYLLEASHLVCGPIDLAGVSLPGSRLDLALIAQRAWEENKVPRNLLPICEHGNDYYCMDETGRVVHWLESGEEYRNWPDLASFLQETLIDVLVSPTGNGRVDEILHAVIGLFETNFPGRITGYYVEGSHADGHSVSTSDIDVRILFKTLPDKEEARRIARLRKCCELLCPILDIRTGVLEVAERFGAFSFKLRSRAVFGRDVRDRIPLLSVEAYMQIAVHPCYYFLTADLRGQPEACRYPLDYPDPEGEFFGYNKPKRRFLDGVERDSIKDLVVTIAWAARAMAVLKARQHLSPRNSDAAKLYREWVNDQWTPFLEELLEKGRHDWNYLIPEKDADRARLRELCKQTLGFENHFLDVYKEYLLEHLRPGEDPRNTLFAIKRLAQIVYDDESVPTALRALREGVELQVSAAAEKALALYAASRPGKA